MSTKTKEISRKWHLIDADGKTLGRLATLIAKLLMGKHLPTFSRHIDLGAGVIIINAGKIKLTGKKLEDKYYYHHSGYPGGLKEVPIKELLKKYPERIIEKAVSGMLPKNKLRAPRMRRLKVYKDEKYPHQAQKPETII